MVKFSLFLVGLIIGLNAGAEPEFVVPVDGELNSSYGVRTDPFVGRPAMHTGTDWRVSTGDQVRASAGGKVTFAGWHKPGLGNMVEIDHGGGFVTRYGHNSELNVKVGDLVKQDQPIALAGTSGRSTGPHVHFEMLKDKKNVDPADYLKGFHFPVSDLEQMAKENKIAIANSGKCVDEGKEPDLKYVRMVMRSGWDINILPLSVEKTGNELRIEFLAPSSYTKQSLILKTPEKSDPILVYNGQSAAINPKLQKTDPTASGISETCQTAIGYMNNESQKAALTNAASKKSSSEPSANKFDGEQTSALRN